MATDSVAIAQIGKARQFLAQAKGLEDIKAVRDMAEAARLYARAAGLGQDAMNEAAEIKLRAERKAGEALKAMPKRTGGDAKLPAETTPLPPKLEDLGITRDQSSNWQAEASLPEEDFEAIVTETKEAGEPLTTKALVKAAKKRREKQDERAVADVVDVLEDHDHDGEIRRTRLLAQFSDGVLAVRRLVMLDPDAISGALPMNRRPGVFALCQDMRAWCDRIESAMSHELRVVGGPDE